MNLRQPNDHGYLGARNRSGFKALNSSISLHKTSLLQSTEGMCKDHRPAEYDPRLSGLFKQLEDEFLAFDYLTSNHKLFHFFSRR